MAPSDRRFGAAAIVGGALLLVIYAALFPTVLPIRPGQFDYIAIVSSPWWVPLATIALAGVLLLLLGLDPVFSLIRSRAGLSGWIGLVALKIALVLQACKLSWQLLIDPVIARQPDAQVLFRDALFLTDPVTGVFRFVAAATIVVGIALFGAALYRSGYVPRAAIALIALGAIAYAAGFLFSMWIAVGGIMLLGAGCVAIGRALWNLPPPAPASE